MKHHKIPITVKWTEFLLRGTDSPLYYNPPDTSRRKRCILDHCSPDICRTELVRVPQLSTQNIHNGYRCIHGQLCSTRWSAVHRSLTSPLDAISALPGAICSPFNVIGSTLTTVARSRSLPQRPGIHCHRTVCGIQTPSFDSFR